MAAIGSLFVVLFVGLCICASAWALVIGMALLFPGRASRAESVSERSPWKTFWVGFGVSLPVTLLASGMMKAPDPGGRGLGFILLLALLSFAMLGLTGPAALVGQRIRPLDPDISKFGALARGTALLLTAALLPWVGWFVFAPLLISFSVGAGLRSGVRKPAQAVLDLGSA